LNLRTAKKTKTGYSTSAEVLEELYDDHPIIPHIINYRQLSKLKSTYSDALQNTIHPESGRVHTIFKASADRYRKTIQCGAQPAEYSHPNGGRAANPQSIRGPG